MYSCISPDDKDDKVEVAEEVTVVGAAVDGGVEVGESSFPACPTCNARATKMDPKFCNGCGYKVRNLFHLIL